MSVPPVPDVGPPWGPAGEVPDWLQPALDAVLKDLQRPTPLELAIGWTEAKGHVGYAGTRWMTERPHGGGTGVPVTRGEPADVIVNLADQLQEQFLPETSGAWGEARPPCPGHGHPAVPHAEDSVAWWICPVTGERLGRIAEAEA